ncbi:MAG TPA: hypothetical protein PLP27_04355 [Crocinitomicaceae bacterium]|nr:hypothetical protein [Crocinitomicaceae bacterium]
MVLYFKKNAIFDVSMKKFLAYFRFEIKKVLFVSALLWTLIFVEFWVTVDLWTAFLFSTGFILLILPLFLFLSARDKYKLKNRVKSKALKPLLEEGFRIIEQQNMSLLTGEYSGFHFDIYFSPLADNISTFGLRGYGGYVFIVYFEPIPYRKELQLYDKYYDHPFKTYTLHWSEKYVRMESQNGLFPSHKKIKKRMDMLVAVLSKEGIVPRSKGLQA